MVIATLYIIFSTFALDDRKRTYELRLISFIILSLVSLILAYRASDFPVYQEFFQRIEPLGRVIKGDNNVFLNDRTNFEIGYKLINSVFRMFTGHVEILYFACNIFILGIVFKFFQGKSVNPFKLLLPYFVFIFINVQVGIIRQMIAIAIFFYSVQFIYKKEFANYLICSALAFCFHRTAIILPFLYFIVNREYSSRFLLITLLIGLTIFIGLIPFRPIQIAELVYDFVPTGTIHEKLYYYIQFAKLLPAPDKLTRGIFENTGIFLLITYIRSNLIKKGQYDNMLRVCVNFALLYILLYIYFFDISTFLYRISYYFIIFKFIIFGKYIECLTIRSNRIIANILLLAYCAFMMIIRIEQGF